MVQLWAGADVVWTGPEIASGDYCLSPGDHAVVVDAGKHHSRSSSALSRGESPVVIRVDGDVEVEVDPRHLRVVAQDHPLRPEQDGTTAAWWLDQLEPWKTAPAVATFVPHSFDSVVRVLHPWFDHDGRPARWEQVAADTGIEDFQQLALRAQAVMRGEADPPQGYYIPSEGDLDHPTAEALVDLLTDATSTPDDVYVAVWEGWGDIPPAAFPGAAHLPTPARGHFLLRGPLQGVLKSLSADGIDQRPAPGIWWPADRSWFLHTEIDFLWTFVAGDTDLTRDLQHNPALEISSTRYDASAYRLPTNRAS